MSANLNTNPKGIIDLGEINKESSITSTFTITSTLTPFKPVGVTINTLSSAPLETSSSIEFFKRVDDRAITGRILIDGEDNDFEAFPLSPNTSIEVGDIVKYQIKIDLSNIPDEQLMLFIGREIYFQVTLDYVEDE